jgi:hypothetical protein
MSDLQLDWNLDIIEANVIDLEFTDVELIHIPLSDFEIADLNYHESLANDIGKTGS